MKNYKYIFFDLDGTLTDSKEGITKSVAYALKSFGIIVDDLSTLNKFIGPPLYDSFCKYYSMDADDATQAIIKYREYFSVTGLYENTVYGGISALLQDLKIHGKTLIIATSKPTVFAVKILEHFNLAQYFTFIAGSELDGTRSKKSEVIAFALQNSNITDLKDVVMVGDRKHDILGAKEHGIDTIGVLYGFGDYLEHQNAGADNIVSSVAQLHELLLN